MSIATIRAAAQEALGDFATVIRVNMSYAGAGRGNIVSLELYMRGDVVIQEGVLRNILVPPGESPEAAVSAYIKQHIVKEGT